ncbi:MAG: hypothetical protein RIC82_09625, partial [Parvibaculum sp.]
LGQASAAALALVGPAHGQTPHDYMAHMTVKSKTCEHCVFEYADQFIVIGAQKSPAEPTAGQCSSRVTRIALTMPSRRVRQHNPS